MFRISAEAFNVTLELIRPGYTEEQIGKLWSGNLLRIWARWKGRYGSRVKTG